jgi:hypothetical protein
MQDIMQLCDVVRETGFAIHCYHKHGHLEKVYENALAHRLRKLGLDVKQQYPLCPPPWRQTKSLPNSGWRIYP